MQRRSVSVYRLPRPKSPREHAHNIMTYSYNIQTRASDYIEEYNC